MLAADFQGEDRSDKVWRAAIVPIGLVMFGVSACSGAPVGAVIQVSDEPPVTKEAPMSPDWLRLAGADAPNAGCDVVKRALDKESQCRSKLCQPATVLMDEWFLRCGDSRDASAMEAQRGVLEGRIAKSGDACVQEGAAILRDGCGEGDACAVKVERWAARCGAEYSTPLVADALERAVARGSGSGETFSLDVRDCAALLGEVQKAAQCVHRFSCEQALKHVDAYRERCVVEGGYLEPRVAVLVMTVVAGAEREVPPLGVSAATLTAEQHPLALHSGKGAALRVCSERVDNLTEYLDARDACQAGQIDFAMFFPPGGADEAGRRKPAAVLRQGAMPVQDDVSFYSDFPQFRLASEVAVRDQRELEPFTEELEEIVALVGSDGATATKRLLALIGDNAEALGRPLLAKALTAKDGAMVPLFGEFARRKVALAKTATVDAVKIVGFARRAEKQPLADVRWDGVLEIEAPSPARAAPIETLLPLSVAAYREAITPIASLVEGRRIDESVVTAASAELELVLRECAQAHAQMQAMGAKVQSCAFGIQSCDDAVKNETFQLFHGAVRTKNQSHHRVGLLLSGPLYEQRDQHAAAVKKYCGDDK